MREPEENPAGARLKDRRPLLERPELKPSERARIGRAVVGLLGWGLVASAVLGLLALWHLIRRGRILRANLAQPRSVSLPEPDRPPPQPSNGPP
jgi:hypothetical protein